ncbi:MAG: hypothetical protein AAGE94_05895 [Acidobacteriota bacterium]
MATRARALRLGHRAALVQRAMVKGLQGRYRLDSDDSGELYYRVRKTNYYEKDGAYFLYDAESDSLKPSLPPPDRELDVWPGFDDSSGSAKLGKLPKLASAIQPEDSVTRYIGAATGVYVLSNGLVVKPMWHPGNEFFANKVVDLLDIPHPDNQLVDAHSSTGRIIKGILDRSEEHRENRGVRAGYTEFGDPRFYMVMTQVEGFGMDKTDLENQDEKTVPKIKRALGELADDEAAQQRIIDGLGAIAAVDMFFYYFDRSAVFGDDFISENVMLQTSDGAIRGTVAIDQAVQVRSDEKRGESAMPSLFSTTTTTTMDPLFGAIEPAVAPRHPGALFGSGSLFDTDDETDTLFAPAKKEEKKPAKTSSLFDFDDETDALFAPSEKKEEKLAETSSLFGFDDETDALFAPAKKEEKKPAKTSSLFGFDDETDTLFTPKKKDQKSLASFFGPSGTSRPTTTKTSARPGPRAQPAEPKSASRPPTTLETIQASVEQIARGDRRTATDIWNGIPPDLSKVIVNGLFEGRASAAVEAVHESLVRGLQMIATRIQSPHLEKIHAELEPLYTEKDRVDLPALLRALKIIGASFGS